MCYHDTFHIWYVWTLHCLHAPTKLGNTIPKPQIAVNEQVRSGWRDQERTIQQKRQISEKWILPQTEGIGRKPSIWDCCVTHRLEVKKKKNQNPTQNHSEHDNSHHIKAITIIRIQGQFILLDSLLPHVRQAHFLLQLLHFFHFFSNYFTFSPKCILWSAMRSQA